VVFQFKNLKSKDFQKLKKIKSYLHRPESILIKTGRSIVN